MPEERRMSLSLELMLQRGASQGETTIREESSDLNGAISFDVLVGGYRIASFTNLADAEQYRHARQGYSLTLQALQDVRRFCGVSDVQFGRIAALIDQRFIP